MRKKTNFEASAVANNQTFLQYVDMLTELAISRFTWYNLPDTIDSRFLELRLFLDGFCVFFNDEEIGYLSLPAAINGPLNVYNIPIFRRAYASNGYNKELNIGDSVLIYNNLLHTNTYPLIRQFAYRLYNIDRTIDINVNCQKTPILIRCDDKEKLSMVNLYKEYDGNSPVICAYKSLSPENFSVLNTDAPYVADKLQKLRDDKWKEVLNYLGITYIDKRERLVENETQIAESGMMMQRGIWLKAREQACEQINKMFGLNVRCEYNDVKYYGAMINNE